MSTWNLLWWSRPAGRQEADGRHTPGGGFAQPPPAFHLPASISLFLLDYWSLDLVPRHPPRLSLSFSPLARFGTGYWTQTQGLKQPITPSSELSLLSGKTSLFGFLHFRKYFMHKSLLDVADDRGRSRQVRVLKRLIPISSRLWAQFLSNSIKRIDFDLLHMYNFKICLIYEIIYIKSLYLLYSNNQISWNN